MKVVISLCSLILMCFGGIGFPMFWLTAIVAIPSVTNFATSADFYVFCFLCVFMEVIFLYSLIFCLSYFAVFYW